MNNKDKHNKRTKPYTFINNEESGGIEKCLRLTYCDKKSLKNCSLMINL